MKYLNIDIVLPFFEGGLFPKGGKKRGGEIPFSFYSYFFNRG